MRELLHRLVCRTPVSESDKEIYLWINTGLRPIKYDQYWVSRSSDSRSYTFTIVDDQSPIISSLFQNLGVDSWQLAIAHHLDVHGAGSQRSCYCAKCICRQQSADHHPHSHLLADQLLPFDTIGIVRKEHRYEFIHAICATKAILPKREYVTGFVALQGIRTTPDKLDTAMRKYGLNRKDMCTVVNTSGHLIKTIIDSFHLRACEESPAKNPQ